MGSCIVAVWSLRRQEALKSRLSGIILSGPVMAPGEEFGTATIALAQAIAKVHPGMGVQKLDSNRISSQPEEVRMYEQDTLVHHEAISAGIGSAVLHGLQEIQHHGREFAFPLLMFFGTLDALINKNAAEAFYEQCSSRDKLLFKVEGSEHETLRDKDRVMVTARVVEWLLKRVAPPL
jgi:acylglycerol lipase